MSKDKHTTIRLDEKTKQLLDELAKYYSSTKSATIIRLIHDEAAKLNLK